MHPDNPAHEFQLYRDWQLRGCGDCSQCGWFPSGFNILTWIGGGGPVRTCQEVESCLRGEVSGPRNGAGPTLGSVMPTKQRIRPFPSGARLRQLWEASRPLDHADAEPARRYLATSGLAGLDFAAFEGLRCHPGLENFDSRSETILGPFPALMAYVSGPRAEPVALYRLHLTERGDKAPVQEKRLLVADGATLEGAAVRLQPAGVVMQVSQGIEPGLAVSMRNRLPLWSILSRAMLDTLVIPSHVRHVVMWLNLERLEQRADGSWSQPGLDAARRLERRLTASQVTHEIIVPRSYSGPRNLDWAKVLRERGVEGIPRVRTGRDMLPTAHRLAK